VPPSDANPSYSAAKSFFYVELAKNLDAVSVPAHTARAAAAASDLLSAWELHEGSSCQFSSSSPFHVLTYDMTWTFVGAELTQIRYQLNRSEHIGRVRAIFESSFIRLHQSLHVTHRVLGIRRESRYR
jgi:hypothetical protein